MIIQAELRRKQSEYHLSDHQLAGCAVLRRNAYEEITKTALRRGLYRCVRVGGLCHAGAGTGSANPADIRRQAAA